LAALMLSLSTLTSCHVELAVQELSFDHVQGIL
jgi:hypothetical protein